MSKLGILLIICCCYLYQNWRTWGSIKSMFDDFCGLLLLLLECCGLLRLRVHCDGLRHLPHLRPARCRHWLVEDSISWRSVLSTTVAICQCRWRSSCCSCSRAFRSSVAWSGIKKATAIAVVVVVLVVVAVVPVLVLFICDCTIVCN